MSEYPKVANGKTSDPREIIMWELYVTGLTKGIENAYEAAIQAGYSDDSARNITCREWFKERKNRLKRKDMLSKAERKLEKTLEYEVEETNEEGITKIKTDLLRIQADVAKHITSTLGKDEGYATRQEQTGKGGGAIEVQQITGMKIMKDDDREIE